MRISLNDFKTIVGADKLHKVKLHAIGRVHQIVGKFFCDKLTVRSACSTNCSQCALAVRDVVVNMGNFQPKKPYAYFTTSLKNAQAKAMEQASTHQHGRAEINRLGERTERDPFDIFEETLNG